LKKQTQFAGEQIGANSYLKGDYDNKLASGARKNKANSKPIKLVPSTLFRAGSEQRRMESILSFGVLRSEYCDKMRTRHLEKETNFGK